MPNEHRSEATKVLNRLWLKVDALEPATRDALTPDLKALAAALSDAGFTLRAGTELPQSAA
jgi:hypothetical protein